MDGWLALITTCCSVLCAHITVKNARYKLNVMGYVTECWSFKDDCINFDLKRSDSSTSSYWCAIDSTHIRALSPIYSNPWMRVLFVLNTDISHLVYFKLIDFVRFKALDQFTISTLLFARLYHSIKPVYFCIYVCWPIIIINTIT